MNEEPRHHRTPDDTEGYQHEVFVRLERVERLQEKTYRAIVGDDMGNHGLADRIDHLEAGRFKNTADIEKLRAQINVKLAWFGGIGTAVAAGWAWFVAHK